MNVSCKVIEDMLPIYYDGICSAESAALIEEHLKDCEQCSRQFASLRCELDVPERVIDELKPLKKIQKKYKKTRLCWLVAVCTILLLIPVAFLGWNEYSAQGVAYSNQNELVCGNAFMTSLKEGDYEKAYSYIDVESKKNAWLQDWFKEEELVNMEQDGEKMFCQLGEKVEALGGIEGYEFVGTSPSYSMNFRGNKVHQITYRIRFEGKEQLFHVDVSEDGVSGFSGSGSFLTDPLAQLGIWGEYLWQDYQGCYYDPELKTYVYYEENK